MTFANTPDYLCPVCLEWHENCICPECPKCGRQGVMQCYHDHGLEMSFEQESTRMQNQVNQLEAEERENDYYDSEMVKYNLGTVLDWKTLSKVEKECWCALAIAYEDLTDTYYEPAP